MTDIDKLLGYHASPQLRKRLEGYIEQECLEARKDEYNHHLPCKRHGEYYTINKSDLDNRIAQLTKLQNKEENHA